MTLHTIPSPPSWPAPLPPTAATQPRTRRPPRRATFLSALLAAWLAAVPAAPIQAQPVTPTPQALAKFQTALIHDSAPVLVNLLLFDGINANTRDEQGTPAIVKAAQQTSWKAVDVLLLAPGIDINAASPRGETALMLASLHGHLNTVRKLLSLGADTHQRGWTALHYAASADHPDSTAIAELLLEHHAYIDAASPNGSTPLMLAAQYGSENMVRLLLEAGADTSLRNQLGLSAVDFAQRSEREFMVRLLHDAWSQARKGQASW